jgi:hypothetical protein
MLDLLIRFGISTRITVLVEYSLSFVYHIYQKDVTNALRHKGQLETYPGILILIPQIVYIQTCIADCCQVTL